MQKACFVKSKRVQIFAELKIYFFFEVFKISIAYSALCLSAHEHKL